MSENKELNLEELIKVAGGKLDKEADEWYDRNRNTIVKRAKEKNVVIESERVISKSLYSKDTITVDILKQKLKELGVDCDDLI